MKVRGLYTLLKFALVGASGVLVNELLLAAQVRLLGIGPAFAVPLAFELAVLWNFALNDAFTFRSAPRGPGTSSRPARLGFYNLSSVGSFVTQLAAVAALTAPLGHDYILASLTGIGLGFLLNYWLSLRIWRFGRRSSRG